MFVSESGVTVAGTPRTVARRQDALLAVHHEFVQTAGAGEAEILNETPEHGVSKSASGGADADAPAQPVGPNSGLRRKFGRDPPAVDDPALERPLVADPERRLDLAHAEELGPTAVTIREYDWTNPLLEIIAHKALTS